VLQELRDARAVLPACPQVPTILGQVYQRIDTSKAQLDNIVEFLFSYPLPQVGPYCPTGPLPRVFALKLSC
jgi:hypothetical protein